MSTGSTNFSDPQFDAEYFERLAVEQPIEANDDVWLEIHHEVQRILESLDTAVRSKVANLQVTAGKTQGRSFYLFTYRSFSRTNLADVDPVVVGLTFVPVDNDGSQIVIETDISGESTGDAIATPSRQTIPATREALFRVAYEVAQSLSGNSGPIAEALLDVSRGT